jgi:hypothetical protein
MKGKIEFWCIFKQKQGKGKYSILYQYVEFSTFEDSKGIL